MNKDIKIKLENFRKLYTESSIQIPRSVVANMHGKCTVSPKDCHTISLFGKDVNLPDMNHNFDCEMVHGNYWGPLDAEEYFALDPAYRVLAILKEDYILSDSFYDGDRGAHNKAAEFNTDSAINGNATYRTLFKMLGPIIHAIDQEATDPEAQMMIGHAAIMNLNPFPGLAMNGTATDGNKLKAWTPLVRGILQEQLDFYDPRIILCGHVLINFLSDKKLFCKLVSGVAPKDFGYVFDRKIVNAIVVDCPISGPIGLYKDNRGCTWIDEDHPNYYSSKDPEILEEHVQCLARALKQIGI